MTGSSGSPSFKDKLANISQIKGFEETSMIQTAAPTLKIGAYAAQKLHESFVKKLKLQREKMKSQGGMVNRLNMKVPGEVSTNDILQQFNSLEQQMCIEIDSGAIT